MSSAIGLLKWSPSDFRSATFMEYTAGMRGYLVSKGADVEGPMTRNELLDMISEHKEKLGDDN